ncbi:MAG: BTAD domain-containing putative transcriptional regulator [Chloroflexota bacterium]|nr:BTAD domain-containing putative transcriptional regulator [Chloroflexota bacterium]
MVKFPQILDQIYSAFRERSDQARVILMHPNGRFRTPFIARLTRTTDYQVFYYALSPDDVDLPALLNGMTHDLSAQNPLFGRHIHMLYPEDAQDMGKLAAAAARDIAELSSQPFLLVLDEYDRSHAADDIQWFIEQLVDQLPAHCKIVINSRIFPRLPWVSMIAQRQALLFDDTELVRDNFYEFAGGEQSLEVYALGPGFVLFNEKVVDIWEGHLPRLLFFFALDRAVITRSEICHAFWPDLDLEQAVNVFHVTKRRLHKALEMDVLVHTDGYYRINPELDVDYDVMRFVGKLMDGRNMQGESQTAAWQDAIDLYRGPFLHGHADPWIAQRRDDFRVGYLEALNAVAQDKLKNDLPEHALVMYKRAIDADFLREDMHREVMRLYMQLGRRGEAVAQFRRFETAAKANAMTIDDRTRLLYNEALA